MSGSLNLLPAILTTSGTVTTDSTRIAGFTILINLQLMERV